MCRKKKRIIFYKQDKRIDKQIKRIEPYLLQIIDMISEVSGETNIGYTESPNGIVLFVNNLYLSINAKTGVVLSGMKKIKQFAIVLNCKKRIFSNWANDTCEYMSSHKGLYDKDYLSKLESGFKQ